MICIDKLNKHFSKIVEKFYKGRLFKNRVSKRRKKRWKNFGRVFLKTHPSNIDVNKTPDL